MRRFIFLTFALLALCLSTLGASPVPIDDNCITTACIDHPPVPAILDAVSDTPANIVYALPANRCSSSERLEQSSNRITCVKERSKDFQASSILNLVLPCPVHISIPESPVIKTAKACMYVQAMKEPPARKVSLDLWNLEGSCIFTLNAGFIISGRS